MPLTQEEIATLEATHKRIAHVVSEGGDWEVVFRRPTRAEYKHFRQKVNNPSTSADAQEHLARACCVYPPTREAFDALLDEWPAIPEAASKAFLRLVGMATDDDVKI